MINSYVFDNDISEVISSCVKFMITAENVFFWQLVNSDKTRICCHCNLLTFWSEFSTPWPVIQSCNISQVSKISWVKGNFLICSSHYEILTRMMEVNRNWITRDVSLTKFLLFFSICVKIIESLIPATHQKERLIIFSCDWAPLHAPDWGLKFYLNFFFHRSISERNNSSDRSKSQCLSISAPGWTNYFLSELFFWNLFFTRCIKGKICCTTTK